MMLNAVCKTKLKSVDYKSIALPAELQGHERLYTYNTIIFQHHIYYHLLDLFL
jgi:hypothetical protein